MNQYIARLNQFLIAESEKDGTVTKTLVGTPNPIQQNHLGQVLGLIDIREKNQDIEQLADFVLEEFERMYYQQLDTIEDPNEVGAVNVGQLFEQALQDLNTSLLNYLEQYSVTIDLKKVNVVLGMTKNQQLWFTQVGDIHAFLIHQRSKNNYTIIDILEKASGGGKVGNLNPLKFFSQIISGRITPKDTLVILTASVLDYFSLEKLKNIFGGRPIVEATLELKQIILDTHSPMNFAGATLQIERLPSPLDQSADSVESKLLDIDFEEAASQDSIKQLIDTERATEKLLNTTLKVDFKKYRQAFYNQIKTYLSKIKEGGAQATRQAMPQSPAVTKKVKQTTNKLKPVINVTRASLFVTKTKAAQAARHPIFKKIGRALKRWYNLGSRKFKALPPKQKLAVTVSFLLIVVLAVSLVRLTTQQVRTQKLEAFQAIYSQAQELQEEAEASIIFNDESRARTLLQQAQVVLENAEAPNKTSSQDLANLNQSIAGQLARLRHLIQINDPVMLANLQNLDANATIAPAISKQGQIIIAHNQLANTLYKINIENFNVETINSTTALGSVSQAEAISPNSTLLTNNQDQLFQYSAASDELSAREWDNATSIDDVALYNNTLYHLSTDDNQIYRSGPVGGGYAAPQSWIVGQINLEGATSLTVDGFIYVLKQDGEVLKLLRGNTTEFNQTTIDPPIGHARQIWTDENSDYLYILDSATQRVVVLDKDGGLVVQFQSEAFDNLTDLVVDETTKQIYVLNGSRVFGISATHLE